MAETPHRDWLEDLLKQPEPPIEDAGFTRRVLQALPPRPVDNRLRWMVVLTLTFVACCVGFLLLPTGDFLVGVVSDIVSSATGIAMTTGIGVFVLAGMLIWGALVVASEEI